MLMQHTTLEIIKFLCLPIDIQKIISLKYPLDKNDGWQVDVNGDKIDICIEKSMYYVNY